MPISNNKKITHFGLCSLLKRKSKKTKIGNKGKNIDKICKEFKH